MPLSPSDAKVKEFFAAQSCLIVETSPAFSTSIRVCMQELGMLSSRIFTTSKFAMAKQTLEEKRPSILIVEQEIERGRGFELVEILEPLVENSKRLIILTSKSASMSMLMEAADGQVDSHMLKPFSMDAFRERIAAAAKNKLEPTPFAEKIRVGRSQLALENFSEALKEFEAARALHAKPSLAWFWSGEALRLQGDTSGALAHYREGRKIQALSYRCVIAEFQVLFLDKRFDDAISLVTTIVQNFPMSSARLKQLFDVVEAARRFDQLPSLYNVYRALEERSHELVQKAENVFFDAGKELVKSGDLQKATAFFETGLQIAGRRLDYVEKIVLEFVAQNAPNESRSFLEKISPGDVGTPGFQRLAFCVDQLTMTGDQLLNRGRELIFAGHGSPEIFQLVVRSFAEAGKETLAESAISKAVESFPELRTTLYKVLADHLPKQAA